MESAIQSLTNLIKKAFHNSGYDESFGEILVSQRREICQFQCNGTFAASKVYKMSPREIAKHIVNNIPLNNIISEVVIADAGFININIKDEWLVNYLQDIINDNNLGISKVSNPLKIIIDYGGPNVAKPLHVGHLRSAILGESLKRLGKYLGHEIIGDVHLGDWGLQMGMIISALKQEKPSLPYFDESFSGIFPEESPVSITDLEIIYPKASKEAKDDPDKMSNARKATFELQNGNNGYRALWKHFINVSIPDLKKNYNLLDVDFDLWKGESDSHKYIPEMIKYLKSNNFTYESQGAWVIDVDNNKEGEMPPFILIKSDGAILYSTTDLATIWERVTEYKPNEIWYVVDKRQSTHFSQLFQVAKRTQIAPNTLSLKHIAFGTMNGVDGKPYKTRDGGIMRLNDLIVSIKDKALSRMTEAGIGQDFSEDERLKVAKAVGIAALKFADLLSNRVKDYIFDIDKFSAFEGKTGPYLLYTTVRIKSIIRKSVENGFHFSKFKVPVSFTERELMLKLTTLNDVLSQTFDDKEPSQICEYIYSLSLIFNKFYHEHHILNAKNHVQRDSWLCLSYLTLETLVTCLKLLGIDTPERM